MVKEPVNKIKIGSVYGTIWQNEQFGTFQVSLSRNYKDQSEQWHSTSNLRTSDLPAASLVLNRCYEWILTKSDQSWKESLPQA